jgi:hypothetical protein
MVSQVVVSTAAGYGNYFGCIFVDPGNSAVVPDENICCGASSE